MASSRKETIVKYLTRSRAKTLDAVATISAESWQLPVHSSEDEGWTVLDLLRHITDAERSMTKLMGVIRSGGEGASAEFDLDRWNASRVAKSRHLTHNDLLDQMARNREALLTFIDSLSDDEFDLRGRHGSGHILSLEQTCLLIGKHEGWHVKEMVSAVADATA